VAIFSGWISGTLLLLPEAGFGTVLAWLGLSGVLLAALSFLDDRRGLSVHVRLLGHLACAGILVTGGLVLDTVSLPGMEWGWPYWAGAGFTLMFLIWMINLYNFMDGMDGFAGGMTVIGFSTCALLGYLGSGPLFAAACLTIAAAAGGFLVFNFPPARIFMGDTGSSVLGLLAGGVLLWAHREGYFPFWAGLLVFSPFIVDATVTLVGRLWRGEKVWLPHKQHYYQRLVQSGWGHRKTVLVEYLLMLACAGSAVLVVRLEPRAQAQVLAGWVVLYLLLIVAATRFGKRTELK